MKKEFLDINDTEGLADYLEISVNKLYYNAYKVDEKYNQFYVNKKNGSKRKILSPIPSLKTIQKKISEELLLLYKTKNQVHGYVKTKGIRTNGKIHVNQKFVLNLDLDNFFPSINFGRIQGLFKSYPFNFNPEIASLLAQLCCHENELPQGSPSSPIISNFICRNLDNQLAQLAGKNKCYYSRYADDITFSTRLYKFPKNIATYSDLKIQISAELKKIIDSNGFKINESKVTLRRRFEHQYVTGLTVNKKLNVKRKLIRQIRAMLYAWDKFGLKSATIEHFKKYSVRHKNKKDSALFIRIIEGKLLFVSDIRGKDDNIFKSLLKKFQKLSPNRNLQNYLSYQGQKIQVFMEGNTDWMHLKNALNSFTAIYKFLEIKNVIKIVEYDANYSVGDDKLKGVLNSHLVSGNTQPIIGIFDSDNVSNLGEFAPKKERRYNNFNNRVYTFYLPRPSHRKTNRNCIEHYYKNEDLTIEDENGRRIYLSEEFDSQSGELKSDSTIRCYLKQKKLATTEGIIDTDVRNVEDESLALSKKDFATNILRKHENFKKVNLNSFALILDIIRDIVKDIEQNDNKNQRD